jgi:hypothetical protein
MPKLYPGGITIGTNLKIQQPNPVADYMVVSAKTDLTNTTILPNQFTGMTTFVVEDENTYVLKNSGWEILGGTQFTGGTVNGDTNFISGLTATTISATTYLNLPVTADTFVTGFTFNPGNYNLTLNQNRGDSFGSFTQSLSILSSDMTITGGTYNPSNGVAKFTNNSGGTFNVTGFLTGYTDTYTTGATYSNNTFTFNNSSGTSFNVLFNTMTGLTVNGASKFGNPTNAAIITSDGILQFTGSSYYLVEVNSYAFKANYGAAGLFYSLTNTGYEFFTDLSGLISTRLNARSSGSDLQKRSFINQFGGYLGIGFSAATYNLDVSGTTRLNGDLTLTSGTNKTTSVVVLTGGNPSTVVVNNSLVKTSSLILLTKQTAVYSAGTPSILTKTNGSFTIISSANGDTDSVGYLIINTT